MVSVGIVGWRGMVGSVLMDRMVVENDFAGFDPHFFPPPRPASPDRMSAAAPSRSRMPTPWTNWPKWM